MLDFLRYQSIRKQGQLLSLFLMLFVLMSVGIDAVAAPRVEGVVEDSEGVALADIAVCLFAYDAPDFTETHRVAHAVTDGAGRFSVEAPDTGDVLLVLTGDQGAGRVKAEAATENAPTTLRYPVRTKIVLLHDNDLHFNFNHLEAFRARVEAYRAQYPNVYLLNAGDVVIRHPDRWPYPGEDGYLHSATTMIETMNAVGYDLMTVGNHELDYIGDLTRQALEKATFPLLGANVEITTDKLPPLKPYHVLVTEERYSVAVLGLTRFSKEGVTSGDPILTANQYRHLGDSHDVFVALTHVGDSRDRQLATMIDSLDVIIGGHTHGVFEEGEFVGDVLFARAGGTTGRHAVGPEQLKYLGVVTVVLENGAVVEKSAHVKTLDDDTPVEATVEKIAPMAR